MPSASRMASPQRSVKSRSHRSNFVIPTPITHTSRLPMKSILRSIWKRPVLPGTRGRGQPRRDVRRADVADARRAEELQHVHELVAEDPEHLRHAGLAADREREDVRAAEEDGA